jgi:nucleoside-diphosphate-sugar epimerase
MKVLFIGGTGTISTAISRRVLENGDELYLLNRNTRPLLQNAFSPGELSQSTFLQSGKLTEIRCDINNEAEIEAILGSRLKGVVFDATADFISFTPEQVRRDFRLFNGRTRQYIAISSASAYQKPLGHYRITESTPLANPYWQYSRDKIAVEDCCMELYREQHFPVTIVRPSHTYDNRAVPLGVHGQYGSWQVLKRIIDGKPVIIQGDGTSLWTMTHNSDFAAGFTGLLGNIHAIGEAVQITSDETLTWNQIYQTIADALGRPLSAVHVSSFFLAKVGKGRYDFTGGLLGDKSNSVVFDNAKLKRLVPGFNANVRFDQGIRQTLEYVLSHRECQQEDLEFDTWCDTVIAALDRAAQEVVR